jgi:hypothetical protein
MTLLSKKDHDPAYQSSQVGALTAQLKASLNSRELAVVPWLLLVSIDQSNKLERTLILNISGL